MMKIVVFIFLLFPIDHAVARSQQNLDCHASGGHLHLTAKFASNGSHLSKNDLLEMTLSETGASSSNSPKAIALDALYMRFGAEESGVDLSRAQSVQFAGFRDGIGFRFAAVHLTLPISAWNKESHGFVADAWFKSTANGASFFREFHCASHLER